MTEKNTIPATSDGVRDRSRWISLAVLCTGMLMTIVDGTIVNVALPTIQSDLGFTQASLAWVVNAYMIPFGGLLLLAGRLGDLVSRRGVFQTGLVVFTAASLVCGIAQSQWVLIAARFVQGIGGALTSAVILGMIVTMFTEPREQAKAIGIYSFVMSAGGALGLLAGGVLTQTINWHWIFLVNVPIGVATVVAVPRLLPRDRGIGIDRGVDALGAVLITAGLMLGVYTIVEPAAVHGWSAQQTLLCGFGSVALLAAFVVREATARQPLAPLAIFKSRTVSGANMITALIIAGVYGMFFLGTLAMQRVLEFDALQIGLAFLPQPIVMGTIALRFSGRLTTRFGARALLLPGLGSVLIGLLLVTRLPLDAHYATDLLPSVVLIGLGLGIALPALTTLAMSDVAPEQAGLASGVLNTTIQIGGAVGVAVLATLSASRTTQLAEDGDSAAVAQIGGYHFGFLVAAGFIAAAMVVVPLLARRRRVAESDA
jgi:EmrB/QacA subfamily drug resistance transporter